MPIKYRKGSLFDAPVGSLLVHACNCRGVWGSGVAAQFHVLFDKAYTEYLRHCRTKSQILGTSLLIRDAMDNDPESLYTIGCLFTSVDYGKRVDSPMEILSSTDKALAHLCSSPALSTITEIHSPMINAGLFNVPWKDTEKLIEKYLPLIKQKWVVWTL